MKYIEHEAIMQKFADHVERSNNSDFAQVPTWNQAVQIVEDFPAADVRPVVRGRWIERTLKLYDGRYAYSIECTHCHEVFTEVDLTIKPTKRNFCPDCGADMREES